MTTTLIRNAAYVIAWDAGTKSHVYMPDADVAFDGGALTFVGRNYTGAADTTIFSCTALRLNFRSLTSFSPACNSRLPVTCR